jgi:hypothetical protein
MTPSSRLSAAILTTSQLSGLNRSKPMNLQLPTIGLIVYGGIDPESGAECEDAVEKGFCEEKNKNSWEQVGACPLTKACLNNPKLRHSGADKNDPNYNVYQEMQSQNDSSTAQLVAMGYNGDLPKAEFKEDHINKQKETSVTVPNTLASKQQQALAKSKTYARNHVQSS